MRIKNILTLAATATLLINSSNIAAQGKTAAISIEVPTSRGSTVLVRPFCKFGLQFLASSLAGGNGVAIVQVIGTDGKPMPCAEDIK
jgi:hypothetical protein